MATNRRIDPVTRDYVDDGKGGHAKTSTLETSMQHAINDEMGRSWLDPKGGSRLWQLAREGASETTARRASDMIRQALKPFLDDGRARDLVVRVERDQYGRISIYSEVHDVAAGQPVTLRTALRSYGA